MPKSSSHMLCTSTTGPGGVAPRLLEPGGNLFWGPPCLPLFSREFPSLISSQVMRLMVVWGPYFENQYIRKRSSLRYDHTCLCRGTSVYQDEITHTQHQANVPPALPHYSQWGSAAAPYAQGRLVPRIQQQPAELPAKVTYTHPPHSPGQAPAQIFLTLLPPFLAFQLGKNLTPTPASLPPFVVITGEALKWSQCLSR